MTAAARNEQRKMIKYNPLVANLLIFHRRTGWPSGLPMPPRTIPLIASLPNLQRRLGRDVIALRSIRAR